MTSIHRLLVIPALGILIAAIGCANRSNSLIGQEPALGITHDPLTADSEAAKIQSEYDAAATFTVHREPWRFGERDGQLITTPYHRIYTTIEYDNILERLPTFYLRALDHYTSAIVALPKPTVPLETYLFQTRGQWQQKTRQMLPDQAEMFSNLGRGGFTTKGTAVLYYIDGRGRDGLGRSRDTFAIAAHEGWHQYTQQTFKHQLPIWLEEGVATYMEGYRTNDEGVPVFQPFSNYERHQTLREAARDDELISLHDLLTRSPQSFLDDSKDMLLQYYAQVWGLTRFLAEGQDGRYKPALAQVLTDAARGNLVGRMMSSSTGNRRHASSVINRIGPAVAQEYFNRDLNELEKQYREFINQLVRRR